MPSGDLFDADAQDAYSKLRVLGVFKTDPDAADAAQKLIKLGVLHDLSNAAPATTQAQAIDNGQNYDPGPEAMAPQNPTLPKLDQSPAPKATAPPKPRISAAKPPNIGLPKTAGKKLYTAYDSPADLAQAMGAPAPIPKGTVPVWDDSIYKNWNIPPSPTDTPKPTAADILSSVGKPSATEQWESLAPAERAAQMAQATNVQGDMAPATPPVQPPLSPFPHPMRWLVGQIAASGGNLNDRVRPGRTATMDAKGNVTAPSTDAFTTPGLNAVGRLQAPVVRAIANPVQGATAAAMMGKPILQQALDALIHNTGAQKVGEAVPPLAPDKPEGQIYNAITELATNPLNLLLAPRALDVSKLGDLSEFMNASENVTRLTAAGAPEEALVAARARVAATSTAQALAAAKPSAIDTAINATASGAKTAASKVDQAVQSAGAKGRASLTPKASLLPVRGPSITQRLASGDPDAINALKATTVFERPAFDPSSPQSPPMFTYHATGAPGDHPITIGELGESTPAGAMDAAIQKLSGPQPRSPIKGTVGQGSQTGETVQKLYSQASQRIDKMISNAALPKPVKVLPGGVAPQAFVPNTGVQPEVQAPAVATQPEGVAPSVSIEPPQPVPGLPTPVPTIPQTPLVASAGELPAQQATPAAVPQQNAATGTAGGEAVATAGVQGSEVAPVVAKKKAPAKTKSPSPAPSQPTPESTPVVQQSEATDAKGQAPQNQTGTIEPSIPASAGQPGFAAPASSTSQPAGTASGVPGTVAGTPVANSPATTEAKPVTTAAKERVLTDKLYAQEVVQKLAAALPPYDKAIHLDEVARIAGLNPTEATVGATLAEMQNLATRHPGDKYSTPKPKAPQSIVAEVKASQPDITTRPLTPPEVEEYQKYKRLLGKMETGTLSTSQESALTTLSQKYAARLEREQTGKTGVKSLFASTARPRQKSAAAPATPRIDVEPLVDGVDAKPKAQITLDLSKGVGRRVTVARQTGGSLGTYFSGNAATQIAYQGDLSSTAHEIGHAIADKHGLLAEYINKPTSPYDAELLSLSQHGSTPPAKYTKPQDILNYRRAEGVAEYIRASALNPAAAKVAAPEFHKYYISKVSKSDQAALSAFSDDVRRHSGQTATQKVQSQVVSSEEAIKRSRPLARVVSAVTRLLHGEGDGLYHTSAADFLRSKVTDTEAPAISGYNATLKQTGKTPTPSNDYRILARELPYVMRRLNNMLTHGLRSDDGTLLSGPLADIFAPLDTTSKKTILADLKLLGSLLVSRSAIEHARNIDADVTDEVTMKQDQLLAVAARKVKAFDRVQKKVGTARATGSAREQITRATERAKARIDTLKAATEAKVRAEYKTRTEWLKADHTTQQKQIHAETSRRMDTLLALEAKRLAIETKMARRIGQAEGAAPQIIKSRLSGYKSRSNKRVRIGSLAELQSIPSRVAKVNANTERRARVLQQQVDAARATAQQKVDDASLVALVKAKAKKDAAIRGIPGKVSRFVASTSKTYANNQARIIANRLARYESGRRSIANDRKASLTGSGYGVEHDIDVHKDDIALVENLKTSDPARYDRINKAADAYYNVSNGILDFLVDRGRLDPEERDRIKARNTQHAYMQRVMNDSPIAPAHLKTSGGVAASRKTIFSFKGSTRQVDNPISNLLTAFELAAREGDRNRVMDKFTDVLETERDYLDGQPTLLASVGQRVEKGTDGAITVFKKQKIAQPDGTAKEKIVPTYWQFEPGIAYAMNRMGKENLPAILGVFRWFARIKHNQIVRMVGFLVRNLLRDTQERLVKSRYAPVNRLGLVKGFKQELDNFKRPPSEEELAALEYFGAGIGPSHWLDNTRTSDQVQERMINAALKQAKTDRGERIPFFSRAWDKYEHIVELSERTNRLSEFRAVRDAPEFNRMRTVDKERTAADIARTTGIDFMKGGEWTHLVNQVIPFTRPHVTGLATFGTWLRDAVVRKDYAALARLLFRASLAAIIPLSYAAAHGGKAGLQELLDQPHYVQDFFYNFKVAPNRIVSIPKDHDTALLSAGMTRAIAYTMGHKDAFDGYGIDIANDLLPVDQSALIGGPMSPIVEGLTNWDSYRQKHIVPPAEENLALNLRFGTRYASRAGRIGQAVTGIDARKLDAATASQFGDSARLLQMVSDWGRADKINTIPRVASTLAGVVRESPGYDSVPYQNALTDSGLSGSNLTQGSSMGQDQIAHVMDRMFSASNDKDADSAKRLAREVMGSARVKRINDLARQKKLRSNSIIDNVLNGMKGRNPNERGIKADIKKVLNQK